MTGPGVVEWVGEQLRAQYGNLAQGIGWQRNGKYVAGIVYEGWNTVNCYVHIVKLKGVSFPPTLLAAMMDYPFNQLKVKRLTAMISARNAASKKFALHLGAKIEGRHPEASPDGDLISFGLLRKDAEKWLTEPYRRRLGEENGRSSQRHPRIGVRVGEQLRETERSAIT